MRPLLFFLLAAVQTSNAQVFTLTQAIERARTQSFQSRIEYEHVLQAKKLAKASYLHLLPQITLNSIASNIAPSWPTLVGAIGDLAPFLLPSRWFMARSTSELSKAEQDSYLLMRLDMGVQIESLFYTFDRDQKTLGFTQSLLAQAQQIRNEVSIRENLGQLPTGSTGNLDSIVNQIQQSIDVLNQVLPEDLAAASAALGFLDPRAVSGTQIDHESQPIESAPLYVYDTVQSSALNHALELTQLDDLIEAARYQRKASYFSWLDPYGDPSLGLGAALPTELAIQRSKINELEICKEQLTSIISQKTYNSIIDYTSALQSFKDATTGLQIQQKLLESAQARLAAGVKVDLFGLVQILQNDLAAEINLESARANYRVARAQIDRLLLQGYYANFSAPSPSL